MDLINPNSEKTGGAVRVLQEAMQEHHGPNRQELEQLVAQLAPVIYFHPEEQSVPVTTDWYLQRTWLVNSLTRTRVPANPANLPLGTEHSHKFYLDPKEGISLFRQNQQLPAKTYVHAKPYGDTHTDLQYWFLYAQQGSASALLKWMIDGIKGHEGKINLNPLGKNNGIWQRITVRINNVTRNAEQVFFPQTDHGAWIPIENVQRQGRQIIVYSGKNSCTFFNEPGIKNGEKTKFNLFSSQLELCIQNEGLKGIAKSFSKSCELISANYLGEEKPVEPAWLHFQNNWGNPQPEHLTASSIKRIVLSTFGKTLEFLLSREILEELVNHLLLHFAKESQEASLTPANWKCWNQEETG